MKLEEYSFVNKNVIDDLPWIADCDFSFLKRIPGLQKKYFLKGDIIIYQGDENKYIYYIDKGRVRLSLLNIEGEEKTIAIITAGNIFGEISALDGQPSPTSVIAITDVVLYKISNFDVFLGNRDFIKEMINSLTRKNRLLLSEIKSIHFKDAYTRLATCIYRLSEKYGIRNEKQGNVKILVHFTHQQMAALMGTSRVTITNILNKMRKEKMIDYEDGFLVVTDEKKLMSIVAENM